MNRQEKESAIQSLRNDFTQSEALFLVGVQGLSVNQIQQLRRGLNAHGARMSVAKNTLAKIAAQEIPGVQDLSPYFKQQIALVFAVNESQAVAKVIWDAAQKNERINLVVGHFESRLIDKDMIKFLATLPPRPVLIARVCGGLKAPLVQHVGLLHHILARFLWVLKQASEK